MGNFVLSVIFFSLLMIHLLDKIGGEVDSTHLNILKQFYLFICSCAFFEYSRYCP